MPDTELRPPPEYAHMKWHWIKTNGASECDAFVMMGWDVERHLTSWPTSWPSSLSEGWSYYSPAVPFALDDTTVGLVRSAIADNPVSPELSFPDRVKRRTEQARAVIEALLKVERR